MKIENILVSIDFSEASQSATNYAVSLAKHFNAKVSLLNVVPPPVIVEDSFLAFAMTTQAEILESSREMMGLEVKRFSDDYKNHIEGFVMEGPISDSILKVIKKEKPDLIVMGRKGKGKSNSVFGSVATAMIRKSPIPVFIIPEKAEFKPPHNITYASDFTTDTEPDKYALLQTLSKKFDSKIHILNVQKSDTSFKPEEVTGKMKTRMTFSKLDYEFHSITDKKVEDGIQNFISQHPTDMLVMVSQPHNLLERMLGQVITKNISYQVNVPLLALKS